jgi:hypothetical protein
MGYQKLSRLHASFFANRAYLETHDEGKDEPEVVVLIIDFVYIVYSRV